MNLSTAVARISTAGALFALAGSGIAQQPYPSKPIRFISPNPPGGSTTAVARLISQKLAESWGQQVIVDNRPGGNGFIGGEALVKSSPDGHTLMLISPTHIITPLLLPAPYDAIKDFAPVATVVSTQPLLLLHPAVPASNLQEFIALAKSMPGKLNYASSGSGSPTNLAAEMFNIMAGVQTQHIPYKGGGPAITDLIGGHVQFHFTSPINVIAHVKSGKLRAIAYAGETRLPALPQVPTFTQAGLPGFDAENWFGVVAPAGTQRSIINRLSTEIARILAMPDIKDKLLVQGMDALVSTPDQFAGMMKTDTAKYAKVIKAANIKIEN